MKLPVGSRLDQLVSAAALSLSVAVLICLSFVFVGCSSTSAPNELYFMRVDLTTFPQLNDLVARDSLALDGVDPSSVSASNAVDSVVSNAGASANDASAEAISTVTSKIQSQVNELKSDLPQYYSVGLWSYCEGHDESRVTCSEPSTSFSFDLSAILDSAPTDVDNILPGIDRTVISGNSQFSRSIICLYISGFVTTTLAVFLGGRKTLFSRGNTLLAIFCTLSSLLITTATAGVTVMYALLATGIKSSLQPFWVQVSLGAQMFAAAWLAVAFSIGALITWLIQVFCCCI